MFRSHKNLKFASEFCVFIFISTATSTHRCNKRKEMQRERKNTHFYGVNWSVENQSCLFDLFMFFSPFLLLIIFCWTILLEIFNYMHFVFVYGGCLFLFSSCVLDMCVRVVLASLHRQSVPLFIFMNMCRHHNQIGRLKIIIWIWKSIKIQNNVIYTTSEKRKTKKA